MAHAAEAGLLVPVKNLDESKSRLRPVFDRPRRGELVFALLKDLVDHLDSMSEPLKASIVTEDSRVKDYLRQRDVHVISEPPDASNLGEVVDRAAEDDFFVGVSGLLVFPVDLPWIDAEKLDELVSSCREHSLVLVPDQNRKGTNVLWRDPPGVVPCQYRGSSSFEEHRQAARTAGLRPQILEEYPSFRFDLDTPEDWEQLLQNPDRLSPHLSTFLTQYLSGIQNLIRG